MFIVIFMTAPNAAEAKKIAAGLVEAKLIACANILSGVQSVFWWEGKVDKSDEVLVVLKTRKALFNQVVKKIQSLHSYKVPEIIALPIVAGSRDYLKWLRESTAQA